MTALGTATHKFIVSDTQNLKDARPVDMRVVMERLLSDMGFSAFVISNTAPVDKTVLWWHKDVFTAKRFDPIAGNWAALTPAQHALHQMQRIVAAASAEGSLEMGDLFPFWDVSAGETKKITKENLITALGIVPDTSVGKIVGYWIGYVGGGAVTELAAKNLTLNSPTPVGSQIKLKPALTVPKAYYHSTGVGSSNVLYLGDWAINTEKQLYFNGSLAAPGVILVGALS